MVYISLAIGHQNSMQDKTDPVISVIISGRERVDTVHHAGYKTDQMAYGITHACRLSLKRASAIETSNGGCRFVREKACEVAKQFCRSGPSEAVRTYGVAEINGHRTCAELLTTAHVHV
jgi:hypothetical protein